VSFVVGLQSSQVTPISMIALGLARNNIEIEVELIAPVAMEKELRFAIREGGRTVGAGVVSKIIA